MEPSQKNQTNTSALHFQASLVQIVLKHCLLKAFFLRMQPVILSFAGVSIMQVKY
jgi:hypothetical protein